MAPQPVQSIQLLTFNRVTVQKQANTKVFFQHRRAHSVTDQPQDPRDSFPRPVLTLRVGCDTTGSLQSVVTAVPCALRNTMLFA